MSKCILGILLIASFSSSFCQTQPHQSWQLFDGGGNIAVASGIYLQSSFAPVLTGISKNSTMKVWYGLSVSSFSPSTPDIPVNPIVPNQFELFQNYPNPFNPSTLIKFSLPQKNFIHFGVYDILGRQVIMSSLGEIPAGTHIIPFNSAGLQSGVYFYRIIAGTTFIAIRKMIILK